MALEKAFRELVEQLRKLRDGLLALQVTIREDIPVQGAAAITDQFGDAVDDLLGWLEEALTGAVDAQKMVGHPSDLDGARRALTASQEHFHLIEQRFLADLVSYERMKNLNALGTGRRGEWLPWVRSVRHGLEQCWQPMNEVKSAFLACWQEIAERVGTTSISVQVTSVGQQISAAALESTDAMREGST